MRVTAAAAIRTGVAIAIAVTAVAAVVLVSVPACDSLPNGICRGDKVNGLAKEDDPDAGRDCTTCLQQKCCDFVGFCAERPDDPSCIAQIKDTHGCVVDGGPRLESRCRSALVDDGGRDLYGCMRSKCGPECQVPSCELDNSVVLIASSRCDKCMGSACCDTINTCYKDRGCKLILECILTTCKSLGEGMIDLRQALASGLTDESCGAPEGGSSGPPPGAADSGQPVSSLGDFECIQKCLDQFAGEDGGTAADETARCRAYRIYTCGATSGCGEECILDAGAEPPADAGADASDAGGPSDASDSGG
jgi:hypothetical protein